VKDEAAPTSRDAIARKSLKRKRASEDGAGKDDDGAGKMEVQHAPPSPVVFPPTSSLSPFLSYSFSSLPFFLKQEVVLMMGEIQRLQEAETQGLRELTDLKNVLAARDDTVRELHRQLKKKKNEIATLKKNGGKVGGGERRVSSYFKTQSSSSTAVASTGIQTESATAVGATDIYQLQDIELQLGLAEIYKREGLKDRSENPGYVRSSNGSRMYRDHSHKLDAFLNQLHVNYPANIAMRGELLQGYLCKLNNIPHHLGEWKGVVSKSAEYMLRTFKSIRDTVYHLNTVRSHPSTPHFHRPL